MPGPGDVLEHPVTGERITFIVVSGELLVMEAVWPAPTGRPARTPPHVHPEMEERWEVLEGTAAFRIGEEERTCGPGESVVAPPGVAHLAWNPGEGRVRLRIEMRPALRWRAFVERLFAAGGVPDAALLREFTREIAAPD